MEVDRMEVLGRWFGITLCILQLTLVPAAELRKYCMREAEAYLIDLTEQFYCRIMRERQISAESLEEYKKAFHKFSGEFSFEIKFARKYFLPVKKGESTPDDFPLHIYYTGQIEYELRENGRIMLKDGNIFQICIRRKRNAVLPPGLYDREESKIIYICGGELL